jgi:hypothetical protein
MTKLGDMFHIPVTDRLSKRRPCVQKTIGRSGTLFCHFLLILVAGSSQNGRAGMPSSVVLLCWLLCCCCCVPCIPAPAATVVDPCTADARALRTGTLTSVKCLFAHLPAHLSTLASKFASEGFASAHDILEAQLDDEDLRGLGVRGAADQQVFRRALGSLLQPPLPPAPPRLSPSSTAMPSVSGVECVSAGV